MLTRSSHYKYSGSLLVAIGLITASSAFGGDFDHQPLAQLAPGTNLDRVLANPNQRLLLLAEPRLASGDVDKAPPGSKTYTSMFKLMIVADVVNEGESTQPAYQIQRVAAGMAVERNGKVVVVSSKQQTPDAKLGMIAQTILASNEKFMEDVITVAQSKTITVFDAKAVMLRDGAHKSMTIRHVVWISPRSGRINMALWLMDEANPGQFQVADQEMQVFGEGLREDRQIHVDATRFSFGLPTEESFALVRIPPGKAVPFSDEFRQQAGIRQFDGSTLNAFVGSLVENLRESALASRK